MSESVLDELARALRDRGVTRVGGLYVHDADSVVALAAAELRHGGDPTPPRRRLADFCHGEASGPQASPREAPKEGGPPPYHDADTLPCVPDEVIDHAFRHAMRVFVGEVSGGITLHEPPCHHERETVDVRGVTATDKAVADARFPLPRQTAAQDAAQACAEACVRARSALRQAVWEASQFFSVASIARDVGAILVEIESDEP